MTYSKYIQLVSQTSKWKTKTRKKNQPTNQFKRRQGVCWGCSSGYSTCPGCTRLCIWSPVSPEKGKDIRVFINTSRSLRIQKCIHFSPTWLAKILSLKTTMLVKQFGNHDSCTGIWECKQNHTESNRATPPKSHMPISFHPTAPCWEFIMRYTPMPGCSHNTAYNPKGVWEGDRP
jgi:hypothetical protein